MSILVYLEQESSLGYQEAYQQDITEYVEAVSTKRGRKRILNAYEAGTATVTIKDLTGIFNPANTSSPYYPLKPMNKIRILVDNAPIYTGYIINFNVQFASGQEDYNKVIISCADLMRILAQTQITTVTGAGSVQDTGTRIDKLLDVIGYPTGSSYRLIATGTLNAQADSGASRNLLDAIRTVQDTENGAFYVSAEGQAVFLNQNDVGVAGAWISATIQPYFYDVDNLGTWPFTRVTSIGFSDAKVNFDDDLIFNDITVKRTGGTDQTASDATSIAAYSRRSAIRENTLNTSDSDTLYIAKNLLNTLKDSEIRIDELVFAYHGKALPYQEELRNVELYAAQEVKKIMPNSGLITKVYTISGIQWDITKDRYFVKFLIQEPLVRLFVLDSPVLGVLDYNGLGA